MYERRRMAAAILDSPELLMMHAQSRGDVSTRSIHTDPIISVLALSNPTHSPHI
jgi:hypothetical protein